MSRSLKLIKRERQSHKKYKVYLYDNMSIVKLHLCRLHCRNEFVVVRASVYLITIL